jgi:hypothetical protein
MSATARSKNRVWQLADGPIWPEARVGSPVQPCRQTRGGKAKKWDMPCLLKIMCKSDKDVIDHARTKVKLYKVDRVYFDDNYFDGKKWVLKRFNAGGTSGNGEITFLSGDSCERAATVLYHEIWHDKQPAGMGWPHPAEDDAYYNTELWTIARGLNGQARNDGLRVKDAKGVFTPDKAKIKALVDREYPVQTTAPPEWQIVDIDKKAKTTEWSNSVTNATAVKPSVEGDTLPGPQITKGKKLVDSKTVKCP